jgi:predicted RNA-binding protein YlqC (UPF0109 family)
MTNMTENLKEIIEFITKNLVDKPNELKVNAITSTKSVIVQIKTDKTDTGKVIGKKGRTIDALKVIVSAIKNTKFNEDSRRVVVEVLEDENSSFSYKNKYREEQ